jgi:hypothetical protein
MNFWLIFFAAQILLAVVALIRDRGEDSRFEGDALGFRS